jgi:pimeloyl-ACP methyl ester carboxylesterase
MPSIQSFDGIKLSYDVDGDGPTVLLLHGYATDAYINWVRPGLVSRLNAAGYRTVALDQRGHGMSGKPHEPDAYSDGAMIKDAVAVLDDLGVDRVAAVGYSMGALNTLRLLTDGESRVRVAVLGGIGGDSIKGRSGEAIADAMTVEDKSTISHPIARSFRDFAELTRADRTALAALQRRPPEPIGDLGAIEVPVLVLCGDNDPMIGDPAELANQIAGAKVAVVGGSHLNVVNNQEFHAEVVAFLDEHRGELA